VSVRLRGAERFGTKAEVKNVNSFRFIRAALEYEIERQIEVIESGGRVAQETRLWNLRGQNLFDAIQRAGARLSLLSRTGPAASHRYPGIPDEAKSEELPELPEARTRAHDCRVRIQRRRTRTP
jgi:aspartyl-tRNA(Asn)/glutamyl-tRNA(Gln) amidotransferase subunit B